jgi:O-antigen ligase
MHNQYVQVFTELGLIGFMIFIGIFYQVGRLKIKAQEYSNMKYIYLTVLLFSFVSEVIFHRQFSMALFALIVGLLLVQYREENEV